MSLKPRNDIHLARRLWHVSGVLTMASVYWVLNPSQAAWLCTGVSAFMITYDSLRLFVPRLNRFFMWLFQPFLREGEDARVSGATAMMAGVTLIVWFFPKHVVLLSLMFLAVADPLASYFGIRYGKDKLIGQKSLQGSLAAFAACFVVALAFFAAFGLMRERLFIVCLLSALIGAAAELVPVGKIDDNFVFPVVSSTLLTAMFFVFGGF